MDFKFNIGDEVEGKQYYYEGSVPWWGPGGREAATPPLIIRGRIIARQETPEYNQRWYTLDTDSEYKTFPEWDMSLITLTLSKEEQNDGD